MKVKNEARIKAGGSLTLDHSSPALSLNVETGKPALQPLGGEGCRIEMGTLDPRSSGKEEVYLAPVYHPG